jgi:hypothetical protein
VFATVGASAFVCALPITLLLETDPLKALAWSLLAALATASLWIWVAFRSGSHVRPSTGAYIGFAVLLAIGVAYSVNDRTPWQFSVLIVVAAIAFFGIYALLCGVGVAILTRKVVR